MLMEVQKNIQELREEFRSEIQSLKNTVSEMKHTMEGFKSRLDKVEKTLNGIEIKEEEYKEAEAQEKKESLRMKEYCKNWVTNPNGTIFVL